MSEPRNKEEKASYAERMDALAEERLIEITALKQRLREREAEIATLRHALTVARDSIMTSAEQLPRMSIGQTNCLALIKRINTALEIAGVVPQSGSVPASAEAISLQTPALSSGPETFPQGEGGREEITKLQHQLRGVSDYEFDFSALDDVDLVVMLNEIIKARSNDPSDIAYKNAIQAEIRKRDRARLPTAEKKGE